MAKSVGKYTGIGYRPLQGDIASDILNAENQEFKYRAEDRIIEDRKAKAKAAKEAARQQGLKRIKHIDLFDTGFDNLDKTIAATVKLAQTQGYPEIFEVLDHPDKYNMQEQIQAQLKLDYLNNGGLVNDLKTMVSGVMQKREDYLKNRGVNGGYHIDPEYEKMFSNGYRGVAVSLDDNLRPVTIFKNTDEDGDGVFESETIESLNDIDQDRKFQRYIDFNKTATAHAKKLTPDITETLNGVTTTRKKQLDPDEFNNTVTRLLYNEDGTPSETMLSFARQRDLDPNIKANLDKIESDYKMEIESQIGEEVSTKKDHNAALNYAKYNDEKGANGISYVESKQYGNTGQATVHRFSFNTPYVVKGTNKSENPKTLTEIRYDQQNGNVVLMGTEYTGKTSTRTSGKSGIDPRDFTSKDDYDLAMLQSNEESSSTTVSRDDWKPVIIKDKAEVTAILSKVMGVNSYDEIVNQLRPKGSEEQKKNIEGF